MIVLPAYIVQAGIITWWISTIFLTIKKLLDILFGFMYYIYCWSKVSHCNIIYYTCDRIYCNL